MVLRRACRFGLLLARGRRRAAVLLVAVGGVLAFVPGVAQAQTLPSITLASHIGGTYDYQLTVPRGLMQQWPSSSDAIVLTGLSGVTGASLSDDLASSPCKFSVSHTTTSVTVTTGTGFLVCGYLGPQTVGTLEVDSAGTTTGTVNWAIENARDDGNASGTVLGPVALPVPTSKEQCIHGGWKNFPQFKNQGECVRYVAQHHPPNG
jgi:hypothetical protein